MRGVDEFYQEILETNDRRIIGEFLFLILRNKFKGHWHCPCGSGKMIRRCHKDVIFSIGERIPPDLLLTYLEYIIDETSKSPSR
jgi:hypothetical protein